MLPCSSAHSSEVFATFDLPAPPPKDNAAAEAGCEQRFEPYAGKKKPEGSSYFIFTVRMEEINSADERGVLCIAHQLHDDVTGSIKD